MAGGEEFNLKKEFAQIDFHEARLEERFIRTVEIFVLYSEPDEGSAAERL